MHETIKKENFIFKYIESSILLYPFKIAFPDIEILLWSKTISTGVAVLSISGVWELTL